ncbi:hypothetical protein ACVMHY_007703 [Bradyrhizobium barranii subsp. barranii]
MPFERHQRSHRHVHRAQLGGTAEIGQIDDEAGGDDIGADLAEELHRAFRGAAGGDEIVDQDDALAGLPVGRSKSPGYGHLKLPHLMIAVSAAEQQ